MTKKTDPLKITLIAFRDGSEWRAEGQEFKYLHPVNGREYSTQIAANGKTKAEALARAQAQLDTFVADRGNTIFEVTPFTADQLARAKS
uniref:DUF2188 domain-containing protein n=1 Tax=Pseudomonas phage Touem01 TaxID=3138548 RepID=A0AAU6W2U3_9VIRU